MAKKPLLLTCTILFSCSINLIAQTNDSTAKVTFNGYVDAYYAYYTDSVEPGGFQKFPSVSPRSKQFGLNTAMVTAQYDASKVRALVTLHYGDIPVSAWSGSFNNIMEAHAGVRLCHKLWLDAGFFRTHVGTEGLLPKENIASSISINTFYEPYFESGVRLNYNPSDRLSINFYILNGYNIYEDNNDKKSLGLLVNYTISDHASIGYSNYTGDDSPEESTVSHLRSHQCFFFNYQLNKLKIQVGGDYCIQQHSSLENSDKTASVTSGVLSLKYQLSTPFAVYARGEFFNDPDGYMSTLFINNKGELTGYKIAGVTAGVEYKPTDNSYVRLEGRELVADKDQEIFYWNGTNRNYRLEVMVNMGVSF